MSRRDNLHASLRHTLEKDGWVITDDPLILVLEQTLLKDNFEEGLTSALIAAGIPAQNIANSPDPANSQSAA
jgi:hypothetical protein